MKDKIIVIILNFLLDFVCYFFLIYSFYIFYIFGLFVKEYLKYLFFVWLVLVVNIIFYVGRLYFQKNGLSQINILNGMLVNKFS